MNYKEHAEGLQRDYDLLLAEYNALKNQPKLEPVAVVEEVSHDGYLFKQVVWKVQPHSFDYGTKFYTTPPQRKPLTDEMIVAGGKALAKLHAESCGLDFNDEWKYYAEDHKADAKAVIEAAHGVKGKNT